MFNHLSLSVSRALSTAQRGVSMVCRLCYIPARKPLPASTSSSVKPTHIYTSIYTYIYLFILIPIPIQRQGSPITFLFSIHARNTSINNFLNIKYQTHFIYPQLKQLILIIIFFLFGNYLVSRLIFITLKNILLFLNWNYGY